DADCQFREQEPGPRGSPQLPHGPVGTPSLASDRAGRPPELTANTESCFSSRRLWHSGHTAFLLPVTSSSNLWWHSLQLYSKIGMADILLESGLLMHPCFLQG